MLKARNKKNYGKPLMFMEKFVPNEFVAGCILSSLIDNPNRVLCFDKDNDGMFDNGEDNGHGNYELGVLDHAESFEVLEKGRKTDNGALGYCYVGSGKFHYNMQPHIEDGTAATYYNYQGSNFVACYYALLKVKVSQYDIRELEFLMDESCLTATTNAS